MSILIKLVTYLSKLKVILISLTAFFIVLILTNTLFKPNFTYLTQTFHYTPDYVYQLLSQIGPAGRKVHLLVFLSDIIMIFLYVLFLPGASYHACRSWLKNHNLLLFLTFLPLFLGFIQLSEVVGLTVLIIHYPVEFYGLARLTSFFTTIKYYLTVICFLLPLLGLCVTITLKIIKNKVIVNGPKRS